MAQDDPSSTPVTRPRTTGGVIVRGRREDPSEPTAVPRSFGTLTVTARVDDQVPERRKIIFDPLPRVDGIDSSGDPITEVRADVYLLSGRRRRAVFGDGGR